VGNVDRKTADRWNFLLSVLFDTFKCETVYFQFMIYSLRGIGFNITFFGCLLNVVGLPCKGWLVEADIVQNGRCKRYKKG
jgi:hypothetical protein